MIPDAVCLMILPQSLVKSAKMCYNWLSSEHCRIREALAMTKREFFECCLNTYGVSPDYPFDDWMESAVFRHTDNKKWFAIALSVSRRKFGLDSDEVVDVVNLKLPTEMFGSFGAEGGVYPAYHMNKLHWISVLLPDATDDVVRFLLNASFEATKTKKKKRGK